MADILNIYVFQMSSIKLTLFVIKNPFSIVLTFTWHGGNFQWSSSTTSADERQMWFHFISLHFHSILEAQEAIQGRQSVDCNQKRESSNEHLTSCYFSLNIFLLLFYFFHIARNQIWLRNFLHLNAELRQRRKSQFWLNCGRVRARERGKMSKKKKLQEVLCIRRVYKKITFRNGNTAGRQKNKNKLENRKRLWYKSLLTDWWFLSLKAITFMGWMKWKKKKIRMKIFIVRGVEYQNADTAFIHLSGEKFEAFCYTLVYKCSMLLLSSSSLLYYIFIYFII
jgi:hypothetical protein